MKQKHPQPPGRLKPRNPLVAASHFRVAGAHVESRKTQRQRDQRQLRRELDGPKGFGLGSGFQSLHAATTENRAWARC